MADERIQLLLDLGQSEENARRLVEQFDRLKVSAKGVADSYEVLDTVINKSVGVVGTYDIVGQKAEHTIQELAQAHGLTTKAIEGLARASKSTADVLDIEVRKAVEATQAHRAMAMLLDEIPAHTVVAGAGVNQLVGKPGGKGAGYGLAGLSYGIQDVITVLSMGGGWGRAMLSMANNVTPVVMSLGLGAGLAGAIGFAVTAASAGVGAIESWWKSVDSDKADAAKEKLQEITAEIKRTNAEFAKLTAASDAEKLSAEGVRLTMAAPGAKEQARGAVAAGLSSKEAWGMLTPEEQKQFQGAEEFATMTDEQMRRRARSAAAFARPAGVEGPVPEEDVQRHFAMMQEQQRTDQRMRRQMMETARRRRAEQLIVDATGTGPGSGDARRRLFELTPGMRGLQQMRPEFIQAEEEAAAREDEGGGPGTDEFAARARRGARSRGVARRARAQLKGAQTDAILKRRAEDIKEDRKLDEAKARGDKQLARDHKRFVDQQNARFKANTPGAAALRKGDEALWQREAVNLQRRAAQQGGMTPAVAARLQRLSEKLGKDMPTMMEVIVMQQQAMARVVSNEATMAQRLEIARRQLQALNKINGQLEASPMPSGLQR